MWSAWQPGAAAALQTLLASSKTLAQASKTSFKAAPLRYIDAGLLLKDVPEDDFLQGEASRAAPE